MILLTGGSGFIGQALLRGLAAGHELLAPSRRELDLLDAQAVRAYLREHPIDAIIHAAVQPGHRNAQDPTRQLDRNTRMFFNLVRAMEAGTRMVFLGSGAVYDTRLPMEAIAEDAFDRSVPEDEHGFSKYLCAKYMEGKDAFMELRLFGVFGPGEDPLIRFISNAICKALVGLPITCRQDRAFSYLWVEDLPPVVAALLAGPRTHGVWNVVPDAPVSLVEAARKVLALTGADVPLRIATPGQGLAYTAANARLRAQLPNLAFTPLDEAIARLVDHYRAHATELDRQALQVDR
jgi:GDP-L-fucose synthase